MANPAEGPPGARPPSATYRLQLQAAFDFDAAAGIAGYLRRLGVSHAYSSPYLQAVAGSTHGYDVVDHSRVSRDLGGTEAHERFCGALGEHGLGQVLDIVPNHMAIDSRENRWWWDLLRHGRESRFAGNFDIDWNSPEPKLRGKVLMPILGDHYGRVLASGDLRLEAEPEGWVVRYFDHQLPIDPASRSGFPDDPARVAADPESLHRLLERQHYRLAHWRTAGQEVDYRRFFDVNSLAALRVEDAQVFHDTHSLVLGWLAAGVLDGIRVDHPDGLRDPAQYFDRLREAAPRAWIVVEKILAAGERLPDSWPVAGTTGYEFAGRLAGLYLDPAGEADLTALYQAFTGVEEEFGEIARAAKKAALGDLLASDARRLTAAFARVCEASRDFRDFTRHDLREALVEMIACLPVYRTYVRPGEPASRQDREVIERAAAEVRRRRPDLDPELVAFLSSILLGERGGEEEAHLLARFQQTSGAVAAKGVEDTAFYVYNRMLALNDVGGDPGRFGLSLAGFHEAQAETAACHPATMNLTSTHDSKRSEDVRVRLALLSEIPDRWREAVAGWSRRNQRHRPGGVPEPNFEYFIYQTLVGAHPIGLDRLQPYLLKAAREAKAHTSWTAPDAGYEGAVAAFAEAILSDPGFRSELDAFAGALLVPGRAGSLAWKLLCLTAPGVPDLYQGSELWDLRLVDPDNRAPVDFDLRRRLLEEAEAISAPEAWRRAQDPADPGLAKLLLVQRVLRLRRSRPDLYGPDGSYRPLLAAGPRADHAVAFIRGGGAVTVAPRLVLKLGGEWGDTSIELPAGEWRDELTGSSHAGGRRPVAELLAGFPVALLVRG